MFNTWVSAWETAFRDAFAVVINSLALFIPNLLGALVIFFIGLWLGRWVKSLVVKIMAALQVSRYFKDSPIEKFLEQADVSPKLEQVIGEVFRLIIILIFFVASVNLLGLTTVSLVLTSILAYIPDVIAAILILGLGLVIAGVVESLVKGSLGSVDIKAARVLAKISSYLVMVFTVLAALSQLRIAESFVSILFTGFVAMLALGFGLSIGLGSKDVVNQILTDWYSRFKNDLK